MAADHPLNSDYDLYSMGRNRDSSLTPRAAKSQDDIVRTDDGKYVGLVNKSTREH